MLVFRDLGVALLGFIGVAPVTLNVNTLPRSPDTWQLFAGDYGK